MHPEQTARIIINGLLEQAGWHYVEEVHAPGSESNGYIDYLLYDEHGESLALLEAKPGHTDPLAGKEQARDYAASRLNVRYIVLSNGNIHYAWDTRNGNPTRVLAIPSPKRITGLMDRRTVDRSLLSTTPVGHDYLPHGSGRTMRPYQVAAVNAIQDAAQDGTTCHLLEMATGTGKTTVAAAVIYLYISTGNAERVMFLVDRIELKQQAANDLRSALDNQYTVGIYNGQPDYEWDNTHVTVISIQTLDRMLHIPNAHFDLIVTDEAHRCISGPHRRMLFESLEGEKIGLTATPRAVVNAKFTDDGDNSPFAQDQRNLRDTYAAFGLPQGDPTYSYTMENAREDGYLVGPTAVDVRTEITRQLMSKEGLNLEVPISGFDESEEEQTEHRAFRAGNYGREFFAPATRLEFAEEIIDQALREPETGLLGKTIVYASSQQEAHALANALNEVASDHWPGVYQSDFAVTVTADVRDASDHGRRFRNNDLNGHHPQASGRRTSKTRVCVTVAMMTTGYDCPDLLNIAICRTMYSPTEFTQVKGRGTRRYDFRDNVTDTVERMALSFYPKERYKIIDFFGVCEAHNEDHIYEPRVPAIPPINGTNGDSQTNGTPPRSHPGPYTYRGNDEVESVTELDLAPDARTITNRREQTRQEHEARNAGLLAGFDDYLSRHPIPDDDQRAAALNLFESYATDERTRAAIDSRQYARLDGTTLSLNDYSRLPTEHRDRIVAYVRATVLSDYETV